MLTKTDFTSDEWKVIRRAPFTAGLVVVAASPSGPIGVVKEMFAVRSGDGRGAPERADGARGEVTRPAEKRRARRLPSSRGIR